MFQLPNSEYVMSQSQVAEAIEMSDFSIRYFLKEKHVKPLPDKSYESDKVKIEKDWTGRGNRQTIKPISISLASEFWATQAFKGNIKAQSLAYACIQEALERRCDTAFQQVKDEEEYEDIAVNNRASWQESRRFLLDAFSRVYPSKQMSFQMTFRMSFQMTFNMTFRQRGYLSAYKPKILAKV